MIDVTAIIVAYGDDPWLERSVEACLNSEGVRTEVVIVDNGCTDGSVDRLRDRPGVVVVDAGENLGFAAGCNAGADVAKGDVIALVNPDAIVEPKALAALATVARRPDVGIATSSLRLADRPDLLNSAGNQIHPTGVTWSGRFEERADDHPEERDAMAATGAGSALRLEVWRALGGFSSQYFMYNEDADLSLRCWQQGLRVRYVPEAVILHRYEFSRNARKMYMLERNRLLMVLSCYEARTLLVIAPLLLVVEVGLAAMAVTQGWWREKVHGWAWLIRNRRTVATLRRQVQSVRRSPDRSFAHLFSDDLLPGNLPPPAWFGPINALLRGYWRLARRLL
jgi:GT2 family glycosyltransferase